MAAIEHSNVSPSQHKPIPQVDELLELNDHCLFEILSILPFADLNSVACTCNRLKGLARKVFELDHKIYRNCADEESDPSKEVRGHFRNFGDIMNGIVLHLHLDTEVSASQKSSTGLYGKLIIELMTDYCNETLKSIEMFGIDLSVATCTKKTEALFNHLNNISFEGCVNTTSFIKAARNCTKLDIVEIGHTFDYDLPNLKEFYYTSQSRKYEPINLEFDNDTNIAVSLCKFLRKHKKLTRIELSVFNLVIDLTSIIQLAQLEDFRLFTQHVQRLDEYIEIDLPNLKRLELSFFDDNSETVPTFMQNLVKCAAIDSLEFLKVDDTQINKELYTILSKCPNLEKLHLVKFKYTDEANIAGAIAKIKHLKDLLIISGESNKVSQILNHLECTETLEELHIEDTPITNEIIFGISRFRDLRRLELVLCESSNILNDDYRVLHRLKKLEEIWFGASKDSIQIHLLSNIKSANTLRELQVDVQMFNDELIHSILRFPNIEKLSLRVKESSTFTVKHLKMFHKLTELNEFELNICDSVQYTWQHLVDLIGQIKELCSIVQVRDEGVEPKPITLDEYENLVKVCREQNKKVFIVINCSEVYLTAKKYTEDYPCELVDISNRHLL